MPTQDEIAQFLMRGAIPELGALSVHPNKYALWRRSTNVEDNRSGTDIDKILDDMKLKGIAPQQVPQFPATTSDPLAADLGYNSISKYLMNPNQGQ